MSTLDEHLHMSRLRDMWKDEHGEDPLAEPTLIPAGITPIRVTHQTHDHVEITMSEEQHEALKKLLEAQQAGRPKSFRTHVKECDKCIVTDDGSVWACKEGSEIRQRERKARL